VAAGQKAGDAGNGTAIRAGPLGFIFVCSNDIQVLTTTFLSTTKKRTLFL
jgi:hypothetical protein